MSMKIPSRFNQMVVYKRPSSPTPSPLATPFTIKALENGTSVGIANNNDPGWVSLDYKVNDGAWTSYTIGDQISLDEGDTVSFSGNNSTGFTRDGYSEYKVSTQAGTIQLFGNIMSLLTGNFVNATDFSFLQDSKSVFSNFCSFNSSIIHTSGLILPASSVPNTGYYWMFFSQGNLQTPPQILATEFNHESCWAMFINCYSLTSGPQIFATSSYQSDSFAMMFNNCLNLSEMKVHFTEWKIQQSWLEGVAANGTFYKPAVLPEEYGDDKIPSNWTVVNI